MIGASPATAAFGKYFDWPDAVIRMKYCLANFISIN